MNKVVGVKLPYSLGADDFYCDDLNEKVKLHDFVVIDDGQSLEIGKIAYIGKERGEKRELGKVVRIATESDLEKKARLEKDTEDLLAVFADKIKKHRLKMNPLAVSYSLDESRIIFCFSADGRIDFRELSRDLSRTLKKQATMRQVGPRDQAKLMGGYGRCGLPVCCASFMNNSSSITMEDVEASYGVSKSSGKVSGLCGRLMCCIGFEEGKESAKKGRKK